MYKVDLTCGEMMRVLDLLDIEIKKADLRLDITSEDFWRGIRYKLDNAELFDNEE